MPVPSARGHSAAHQDPMTTFAELLTQYPRLVITGAPNTGKSFLSATVSDRAVVHTDWWIKRPDGTNWAWDAVPFIVIGACNGLSSFVVEGVRGADAVRQGLV